MPRCSWVLAAMGLVVLTNAGILAGVWWNRSPEPESQVVLSERELALPYRGRRNAENSGLDLRLIWRMNDFSKAPEFYTEGTIHSGTPDWLDVQHLAALGFDTTQSIDSADARLRYSRQLPREALLVLELAGPSWEKALERAREHLARQEAAAAANPGNKEFSERARRARSFLQREERANSRLFAVDVGRDLGTLRARYPDRTRFLIVPATVRPQVMGQGPQARWGGHVSTPGVARLHVPFEFRPILASLESPRMPAEDGARTGAYEVTLATGRRLESWIESITLAPAR